MPQPLRSTLAACALLAACSTAGLHWARPAPEDPDPRGPRYLRFYKEAHFRALGDRFVEGVTQAAFLREVQASRVLFLGDHHVDHDLHARMLALLMDLHERGLRPRLGVECVGVEDTAALGAFLQGEIPLATLAAQAQARWRDSWLSSGAVDKAFYRELLQRAQREHWPVFALEPTPRLPLYDRDRVIASRIRAQATAHPRDLIVVIVGHTHLLGEGRLTQRVDLPSVAVCPRLSVSLAAAAAKESWRPEHRYARSNAGVLFPLPLAGAEPGDG